MKNRAKNCLIITVGTRDVQLLKHDLQNDFKRLHFENNVIHDAQTNFSLQLIENNAYPDYYCLASPRKGGKIIFKNYEIFKKYIRLPIIYDTINTILQKHSIHEVYIVTTDQIKEEKTNSTFLRNYNNDTIFFTRIIEKKLKEFFPKLKNRKFIKVVILEHVADIDFQYSFFGQKLKHLLEEKNIQNIFLLPQGGIDQINHALTLKLIQAFGRKVHLWQQSETLQPQKLKFTNFFLEDLAKHQIQSLINNGEYKGALAIAESMHLKNKNLKELLLFASFRIDLLFDDAKKIFSKYPHQNLPQFIIDYMDFTVHCSEKCALCFISDVSEKNNNKFLFQTIETFHIADFFFQIHDYTKFTLKFHVFLENLVTTYLSYVTPFNLNNSYHYYGKELIVFLRDNKKTIYSRILNKLNQNTNDKIKNVSLDLSFPALVLIAMYYARKNRHRFMLNALNFVCIVNGRLMQNNRQKIGLNQLRNRIAHDGKGVTEKNLLEACNIQNATIEWWNKQLKYLRKSLTQGVNSYQQMNKYILHLFNNQ